MLHNMCQNNIFRVDTSINDSRLPFFKFLEDIKSYISSLKIIIKYENIYLLIGLAVPKTCT